ncbi:MAG: DUF2799 domain-containing protein [Rhizobiaceae bacterium]|nr:DUF2799 domain-containing protein [Rhizobiaceae bacterium]
MHPSLKPTFPPKLKWICCLFPALIVALVALNSCATLTKQQCKTADWHLLGVNDGLYGRPHSRFERHVKACKKANVAPDREKWLAGHKEGARRYCRLENAFEQGQMGLTYHGICEGVNHIAFVRVYRVGYKKYRLEQSRDELERKIFGHKSEIFNLNSRLNKGKIDSELAETKIDSLEDQIDSTEIALTYAENELNEFNSLLLQDGYLKIAGVYLVHKNEDED